VDPAEPRGGAGGEPAGREPLSEEEIRGLLGEDGPPGELDSGAREGGPAEDASRADRPSTLVLLVSRDDDESRMVRGALTSLGVMVDWVRNPFAALDQLRRRQYAAVVSNFEMWADQGALLFQRLAQRGSRTRVIFLCPGAESAARARAAGADEALRRPLDGAGLDRILRLLGRLEEAAAGPRVEFLAEAGQGSPGNGGEKAPRPSRPSEPRESGTAWTEVSWLRFFFEARKAMRSLEPGRARLEVILEAIEREVGASAGIAVAGPGGWWIRVRPGSSDLLWHLAAAVGGTEGGSAARFSGRPPEIALRFSAGGIPAAFAAILPGRAPGPTAGPAQGFGPDPGTAAGVPETFVRELSALLLEAGPPA